MKFKVGDRVRCTKDVFKYKTENKTGTVKHVYNDILYISFDEIVNGWKDERLGIKKGHGVAVNKKDLELIEENADTFTLDDLKIGYLVELRDSSINIVMECTGGKVLVDENGGWLNLNDYNNNFKFMDNENDFDMMKIYGFSFYKNRALKFFKEDRKLLWERKEILDDAEKEYLSSFIRPFKDRVKYIKKWYDNNNNKYLISAEYKDGSFPTNFPFLENKDMYKNMEVDRAYTLEELGL